MREVPSDAVPLEDAVASPLVAAATTPKSGTRKRLDHVDAMRPVKQAAVISTHTLVFFAPLTTSSTVVGMIMLTRFSRDAFLFVSACMLAYSYKDTAAMKLGVYFKKRFISVGVPYLAWTVIYYFYTSAAPVPGVPYYTFGGSGVFATSGLHYFIHILLTGYYHLYYLLVIMEFYLLFPLLLRFVRRFPNWHGRIMVASLLWQIGYGALVSSRFFGFHISGLLQTRLVISYPIYVVGGVIVALHLSDVHAWIVRHSRWIIAGTVLSAVGAEVVSYLGRYAWMPQYLRTGTLVFSPTILPYNVGAILCVYLLGVYLVSAKRSDRTRAVVKSGSDNSYGVYLSQMIWIPLLLRLRNDLGFRIPWGVAVPVALVLVYLLGFLLTALVTRTPLAKAVAGRSQMSWSSLKPRRFQGPAVEDAAGPSPLELTTS